jgi:hypothetical protein
MTTRRFTKASIAVLLGAALFAAIAGTATAHVPSASLTCNSDHQPQLLISLTSYTSNSQHLNQNTVSASIDGVSVLSTTHFGSSYSHTFSAGSSLVGHTAQVIVFAWDDPTGSHGWTTTINLTSGYCQKPTSTPTPTATPTATPTPTPTPFESFQGETATPPATATPYESFEGVTGAPDGSITPPPTSTGSNGSTSGSTPLTALLICFAFGGLGVAAVEAQRRTVRR